MILSFAKKRFLCFCTRTIQGRGHYYLLPKGTPNSDRSHTPTHLIASKSSLSRYRSVLPSGFDHHSFKSVFPPHRPSLLLLLLKTMESATPLLHRGDSAIIISSDKFCGSPLSQGEILDRTSCTIVYRALSVCSVQCPVSCESVNFRMSL